MGINYYDIADTMLEIVSSSAEKTIKNICEQITDVKKVSTAIGIWLSSEAFIHRVININKDINQYWTLRHEVYLLSLVPLYYSMFRSNDKLVKIKPMIEALIDLAYRAEYSSDSLSILAEINEITHKHLCVKNIDLICKLKAGAAKCALSKDIHKGHILLDVITDVLWEVKNDSNNN